MTPGARVTLDAVICLAVAAAACSSGSSTPTSPSSTNPAATTAAQIVVHDTMNPPATPGNASGVSCDRSVNGDHGCLDDFVSPANATIRTVTWQGYYAANAGTPPHVAASFYLAFASDNGKGGPLYGPDDILNGRLVGLYHLRLPIEQVNERFDALSRCDFGGACALYDYSVTLPTPFAVSAGVRYWLFVQPDVLDRPPASTWGWRRGTSDNGVSIAPFASATFQYDLAFSLR